MDKDIFDIKLQIEKLSNLIERHNEVLDGHIGEDRIAQSSFVKLLEKVADQSLSIQEQVNKLDKKLDLDIQNLTFKIEAINSLDEQQNKLIDEHIAGVNTLKEMHSILKQEYDKKFTELESPKKFWDKIKKDLKYWLTIATVVVGLLGKNLFS